MQIVTFYFWISACRNIDDNNIITSRPLMCYNCARQFSLLLNETRQTSLTVIAEHKLEMFLNAGDKL